jgi:hypothetical protein
MSEPIIRYDKDGNEHVMHSPSIAQAMVEAGLLFVEPPVLTPDDTQEVAAVKPPKRKREKGDGGVL